MSAKGKPDLEIKLDLNLLEALKNIEKLTDRLEKLGKEGLGKAEEKAKGLGEQVSELITHQGYSMLRDAATAMSQGFEATANHVKTVATEYLHLQEIAQQVAALQGKQNTGNFTSDQARQAAAAGLKPEEWIRFQEQFQSYGGASLEKLGGEEEQAKYQQQLAGFAKARGINPAEIAQMGGGILQFSEKNLTADEAMAQLGRQFSTLERAPTPVPQLLPQMTRIQAQGATGDEAAQLLNIASNFAPGEEGTAIENTLKALQNAILDEKGGELGVSKEMSPLQRIKAAAENLSKRKAGGEDIDPILKQFFPDLREQRGIKGFMSQGVGLGRFDQAKGYIESTPADFAQKAIGDYLASDRGKNAQAEANLAASGVESGEKYQELERLKKQAETNLNKSGRFEDMTGVGDTVRNLLPGVPDIRQQLINEEAYRLARQKSGNDSVWTNFKGFGEEQSQVDKMILEELKSINGKTPEKAETRPPLSAPPANPRTRPQ